MLTDFVRIRFRRQSERQNPEYMAQMAIVISEVYDCLTDDERQQLAIDTLTHTEE